MKKSDGIRQTLINHAAGFYRQGLMLGTAGNLSARADGEEDFWITASGCSKGELKSDDFVKVDLNGNTIEKLRNDAKPSAETSIHVSVYKHYPAARACYHVHSPEANIASIMAQKGWLNLPRIEMLKGFGYFGHEGKIRVFENHDSVPQIADEMSAFLAKEKPEIPAMLIKGHGITVWAETQEKARNYIELTEFIFKFMVLEKLACQ